MDKQSESPASEGSSHPIQSGSTKKKQSHTQTTRRTSWLPTLFALLAISIASAALYFANLNGTQLKTVATQNTQINSAMKQQITTGKDEITTIKETINKLEHQQTQQHRILNSTITGLQRIMTLNTNQREDWILNETEYLMRLALLHLEFNRDIATTITLLKTADSRLQSLGEPALMKIRQTLADNIAALQAIPPSDLEGLLSQLNAVSKQIETLPLASPLVSEKQPQAKEPTKKKESTSMWRGALNRTWEGLQNIIIIRHHEKAIHPLLTPKQQTLLIYNIQLLLRQVQWAALQNNAILYTNSLQEITDLIKKFFTHDAATTQSVLTSIETLKQRNVKPKLPDISNSLQALQKVIKKRHKKAATNKASSSLPEKQEV